MDSPVDWLLFDKDWLMVEFSSRQTANYLVIVAEANHLVANHLMVNQLEANHLMVNQLEANHLVVMAKAREGSTKQDRHAINVSPGQKDSGQQNTGRYCLDSKITIWHLLIKKQISPIFLK